MAADQKTLARRRIMQALYPVTQGTDYTIVLFADDVIAVVDKKKERKLSMALKRVEKEWFAED